MFPLSKRFAPEAGRRSQPWRSASRYASLLFLGGLFLAAAPAHRPSSPVSSPRVYRPSGSAVLATPARLDLEPSPRSRGEELRSAAAQTAHVPVLTDAEAWSKLPAVERGQIQPLPAWALALARTLPHTTAAMLELDYLHRARSPLDARLRGQLRWTAAHANSCAYGEAYAVADLRRAGIGSEAVLELEDPSRLDPARQAALVFARKLSRAADTVTDDEVARLIAYYGEKDVVAMVLLLAHASFQDRVVLALGLPVEPNGPVAPVTVRFARLPLGAAPANVARRKRASAAPAARLIRPAEPEWPTLDLAAVGGELDRQRARHARITLPAPQAAGPASRWGMVCRAYQPELAAAWSYCMRMFEAEADLDPVFEASVFWVVTQSVRCFY